MALEFAFDGGAGEGGERRTVVWVEPVDGLHQAEHRHLPQIVVAGRPTGVALGDVGRQTEVALDDLVAQRAISGVRVLAEERVVVDVVHDVDEGFPGHRCRLNGYGRCASRA